MFEDDFTEMMVDEITWEQSSGLDANGMRAYGSGTTVKCRIEPKTRKTQDSTGADVVSHVTIYTFEAPQISPKDRITLPDGEQPPILVVRRPPDRDGAHHTEVLL